MCAKNVTRSKSALNLSNTFPSLLFSWRLQPAHIHSLQCFLFHLARGISRMKRKTKESTMGLPPAIIRHRLGHNQPLLDHVASYYEEKWNRERCGRDRFCDARRKFLRLNSITESYESLWAQIDARILSEIEKGHDSREFAFTHAESVLLLKSVGLDESKIDGFEIWACKTHNVQFGGPIYEPPFSIQIHW